MDEDETTLVLLGGNHEDTFKTIKKKRLYKCRVCNEEFPSKRSCASHKQQHASDVHRCDICNTTYNTRKYLQRHRMNVHAGKQSKYKCGECGRGFPYPNKLREHQRVHTGEKPHSCEVCGKTFRVHYTLNIHRLTHTDERPYKCAFCAYACRDTSTLRKHEARHTGAAPHFQCRQCHTTYKTKQALKAHVAELHLSLHAQKLPCDICHNLYKNKYTLRAHKRLVHERANAGVCAVCHAHIPNMNNYAAHLQTHSRARPYTCRHCSRSFNTKGNLLKHSYIHRSGSEQHACAEPTCARLFVRRARRDKHLRMHTVRCALCESSFPTKKRLSRHMLLNHQNIADSSTPDPEVTLIKEEMLDIEEHDLQAALASADQLDVEDFKIPLGDAMLLANVSANQLATEAVKYKADEVEDTSEAKADDSHQVIADDCSKIDVEEDAADATDAVTKGAKQQDLKLPPDFPEDTFRRVFLKRVGASPKQEDQPKHGFIDKSKLKAQQRDIARILKRARRKARQREKTAYSAVERARQQYNARLHAIMQGGQRRDIDSDPSGIKQKLVTPREKNTDVQHAIGNVSNDTTSDNDRGSDTKPTTAEVTKSDTKLTTTVAEVTKNYTKLTTTVAEVTKSDTEITAAEVTKSDEEITSGAKITTTDTEVRRSSRLMNKPKREYSTLDKYGDVSDDDSDDDVLRRRKYNNTHAPSITVRHNNSLLEQNLKDYLLPRLNEKSVPRDHIEDDDDYLNNLSMLKFSAKEEGKAIVFPCDKCCYVSRALGTLKLHRTSEKCRRNKDKSTVMKRDCQMMNSRAKTPEVTLKKFFENNMKGFDIRFEQFAEAFKDIDEYNSDAAENMTVRRETVKVRDKVTAKRNMSNNKYVRVIRMTQREYQHRLEIKNRLREKLAKGNSAV